jgi:hypothetical protein
LKHLLKSETSPEKQINNLKHLLKSETSPEKTNKQPETQTIQKWNIQTNTQKI